MEEGERYLYEFFSNDENVDKLVGFLIVEEKKGRDKFNGIRFSLFKVLVHRYSINIILLLPYIYYYSLKLNKTARKWFLI